MCQHGGPAEECGDPHRNWYPQRTICYATMEAAAANWAYDKLHEERPFHDGTFPTDLNAWSDTRSSSHPYDFRDGVTIWVAAQDLSPDDDFLHRSKVRSSTKDPRADSSRPGA